MALKPLNSVGGFSVGEIPANVILANSDIFSNRITVNAFANLGGVANLYIGGGSNGQVLQTDGSGNLSWSSSANINKIQNGNSNVTIPDVNGNVYINANTGTDQQWNFTTTGNTLFPATGTANLGNLVTANFANFTNNIVVQGNIANANNISITNNLDGNTANFSGNLVSLNANLGNLLTANYANFANDVSILGNISNVNNISITLNLDGNTANFSGNLVSLNANLGNLVTANYANFVNGANVGGNLAISNSSPTNGILTDNLYYANGQPWDLQEAAGANTQIQYNDGNNNFGASSAFTFDYAGNVLTVTGNAQFNNANLGNLATANFVNVSGNTTTNNLTVNLQLDGNTANFTGNLTAGNVDGGNLVKANNFSTNGSGGDVTLTGGNIQGANVVIANSFTSNGGVVDFSTNNANVQLGSNANVHILGGSSGQVLQTDGAGNLNWYSVSATGIQNGNSNVTIPFTDGNVYINANAGSDQQWNFDTTGVLTTPGNIDLAGSGHVMAINDVNSQGIELYSTNYAQLNYNNDTYVYVESDGVWLEVNAGTLNLDTSGNVIISQNLEVQGNIANANNISATNSISAGSANVTNDLDVGGNIVTGTGSGGNITGANVISANTFSGVTANLTGNLTALNADLGNLATANFVNVSSNTTTNNLTVNLQLDGNTANFTGNLTSLNADLGNLAIANFVNVSTNTTTSNLTVNLELSGNTANFSGNVITPNLTVNLQLDGNTANFTGNVVAANFIGSLANGNSNVKVYQDANVEITVSGSPNTATFASTGLYVVGQINTTAGNMLSNGNITANLFLNSANANVTGQAELGSVLTSNITATSSSITISAAGANNNIILSPTGIGNVTVGLHNITQVALPVNPNDAATKEYVDNISQGLYIHPAANVTSTSNLNASYLNGGTPLTVTTISGGTTLTFSTNHGLSVDSDIEFTNTFNGITAGEQYFVYSVPAPNQITIKNGYFGAEITTLTDGTGLTQPALAEGGIGATLTNAGAQAALTIDGILMTVGARVLVQGQTNQAENGIYSVTTVGTGATNWVLTRATDGDSYAPKSNTQLGAGSYFFIMQGSQYAGSSYVLTSPPGEINFGTSNIVFSQFSQAGAYTAGNGIAITGTLISANTDNITTSIVGGNIVIKSNANLTTPNLGDATFSSLSWNSLSNGNVTANNLSIGNIANITGNLRVDGLIQSNGNVSSNAFINGNNAYFTNFANIGGNLLANNITSNNAFSTNTANITSNLVTSNATVNLALSGNTANFSGNVIVNNLTVNLELAGNTANFTGNITSLNANLGNLATANFINVSSNTTTNNLTVNLEISGNTANFTGNITTLNANLGNLITANFANFANDLVVQGNIANANNISVTNLINGNTANFSGNVVAPTFVANTSVLVGNTAVNWGTLTTASIAANQTIAQIPVTGITGIEFLIKGIDSAGAKYSVATVQAVTDGANVDYSIYGGVYLTASTGVLAVNITGGNLALQVTPSSTNSTVWTTQFRTI